MKTSKKFTEVETAEFITSYFYDGHMIDVDDNFMGGYNIFVDGKFVEAFTVGHFQAAQNIPDKIYQQWQDDNSEDRMPVVEELWDGGYLPAATNQAMWSEFHDEVEHRVKKFLNKE